MSGRLRFRLALESCLAATALALCVLTLVQRDWVEELFGVDPDRHSGGLEWVIALSVAALGGVSAGLIRVEWRRWHRQPGTAIGAD